jgi:hypothetical protein
MRKKKREGVASGCMSLTWTSKYQLYIYIYEKEALFSKKNNKKKKVQFGRPHHATFHGQEVSVN